MFSLKRHIYSKQNYVLQWYLMMDIPDNEVAAISCVCVCACCVVWVYLSVCVIEKVGKIKLVDSLPSELRLIVPKFGIQSTNLFITHQGIIYWRLWLSGQRRHLQQILMDKTATLIDAFRWMGAGRTDWQTDFSFHYLSRVMPNNELKKNK